MNYKNSNIGLLAICAAIVIFGLCSCDTKLEDHPDYKKGYDAGYDAGIAD